MAELLPDWPTVPNEIAGTDASRPWIEGRDAAVCAFIRALADHDDDLTTLLAGLKAKVERLRAEESSDRAASEIWRHDTPGGTLQHAYAGRAEAKGQSADRLEHLIKQAGGEA